MVFCLHSCFSEVSKNRVSRGPSVHKQFFWFLPKFLRHPDFLLFYTDFTDIVQRSFITSVFLDLNIQFHKIFEPIVFFISLALGYVLIGPSSNLLLKCQKLRQDPLRPSKNQNIITFYS